MCFALLVLIASQSSLVLLALILLYCISPSITSEVLHYFYSLDDQSGNLISYTNKSLS